MSTTQQAAKGGVQPDSKSILRQKLGKPANQDARDEASGTALETGPSEQSAEASIFDYQLRGPSSVKKKASGAPEKIRSQSTELKKPLSRPATAAGKQRELSENQQRRLDLTPLPFRAAPEPARSGQTESKEVGAEVAERLELSREILFSRFLAGIIDLTLPLGLGVAFTLAASYVLGFDLFEASTATLLLVFSATFFLFNSLFFLLSAGRTPGMHLTDLELRNADGTRQVAVSLVLLRVVIFPPAVISVFGLLWAVFDPSRRCLHDHLSGTKVVPLSD